MSDTAEKHTVVIPPSGPGRERNPPARRLGRYRDWLTRVIKLAMSRGSGDDDVRDEEGQLVFNEADNRIVTSGLISKDGLEYHLEPQ